MAVNSNIDDSNDSKKEDTTTIDESIFEDDKEEDRVIRHGEDVPPKDVRYSPDFLPESADLHLNKEIKIAGENGEIYSGQWPRKMMENAYYNPDQATWIGYKHDKLEGLREIPIELDSWFTHTSVFGTTGQGKTTLLNTIMTQWAWAGYGFTFVDPNGDAVEDMLRKIPAHRLDDVIWVEPGTKRDKVVGLNFLEASSNKSSRAEKAAETEGIIEVLKSVLKDEAYWGELMDGVLTNIARGMIQSDKNYTLIDMYYVFIDETYREMFVEDVDDPVVRDYTEYIAEEMDGSDLDAITRRLKKFVENELTREIISHRESSFDIKEAIESDKIILVKNDVNSKDAQNMISVGMMQKIWSAIKSRQQLDKRERDPYFLVIDEFDNVATDDLSMEKMLSEARKLRLSITLSNQQPSQLPKSMVKAMLGNTNNLITFNPKEPDDTRLITKRFPGFKAEDLQKIDKHTILTRVLVGDSRSEPITLNTFAPYPEVRSEGDAERVIQESLRKYGRERLDPVKAANDRILETDEHDPGEEGELITASVDREDAEETEKVRLTEKEVIESLYSAKLQGNKDGFITVEDLHEEIQRRSGEEIYKSVSAQVIEKMSGGSLIDVKREGEQIYVDITDEGERFILSSDSGRSSTGGSAKHRITLQEFYETFTKAGYKVTIPEQDQEKEVEDGFAEVPLDMSSDSIKEMKRKEEKLKEEGYNDIYNISEGRDVNIEIETTTIDKPKQTIQNLKKAVERENVCAFGVLPTDDGFTDNARRAWNILTDPPLYNRDTENGKIFYNKGSILRTDDGDRVLQRRENSNSSYWQETENGKIQLVAQKDGEVVMELEYDSDDDGLSPNRKNVNAYYRKTDTDMVTVYINKPDGTRKPKKYKNREEFMEEWIPVREPYIPDIEFPRKPEKDDWMIIITGEEKKNMPPVIYTQEDGDERLRPLLKRDRKEYGDSIPVEKVESEKFFDTTESIEEDTSTEDKTPETESDIEEEKIDIEDEDKMFEEFNEGNGSIDGKEDREREESEAEERKDEQSQEEAGTENNNDTQEDTEREEVSVGETAEPTFVEPANPYGDIHILDEKGELTETLCGEELIYAEEVDDLDEQDKDLCPKCKTIWRKKSDE